MLDHLKAHNRAIERGIRNINKFLDQMADSSLDENGRCRIQYRDIGLHVVVMPEHNLVIFKTFINMLPDPGSGKLLPLYYHLLDMNDEPQTGMAYFAIVASEEVGMDSDVISVETKRPIVDISLEEFKSSVETVGEVANHFMGSLEEEFHAPVVP